MNEQLRKAIAEATNVPVFQTGHNKFGAYEIAVNRNDHHASQAKLLRVIELLVQQRDDWISANILADPVVQDEEATIKNYVESDDAELIAALEEEKDNKCYAVQMSDSMVCNKCGITWDVNDIKPPRCNP